MLTDSEKTFIRTGCTRTFKRLVVSFPKDSKFDLIQDVIEGFFDANNICPQLDREFSNDDILEIREYIAGCLSD